MKRMSQSLICRIKIIFFQENIEQIRQSNARTIVHRFIQIAYLKTVYAIFGLQNDGDMWEIESLLSLIIQGRKIEFDSVASDYSYAVQSWQAFQPKMSIDGFPPFNPDISLPVNRHQIFDSIRNLSTYHPVLLISTIPEEEKGQYSFKLHPQKRVNGAISLDYAPFIDNEQRQEGQFYRAILASSRQHIC